MSEKHHRPWRIGSAVRGGGVYIRDAAGHAVVYVQDRGTAEEIVVAVNQQPVLADADKDEAQ